MYATALVWIALLLPADAFQPGSANYVLAIGALGVWRYSLRVIHFVRGMLFLHREYPRLRREVEALGERSEEHTSELQSLMRISYAVFCLKKKNHNKQKTHNQTRRITRSTQ